MTHVLVKWLNAEKWDVYPLKALPEPAVGVRLMSDAGSFKEFQVLLHTKLAEVKVDIGYGVLVEQSILTQLSVTCHGGPGKDARALLRHLFDDIELEGRSLFGGKGRGSSGQKEALDPVRVKAIIGYTCTKFPGCNVPYLKNSLSNLLVRSCK
ncbi:hypothetical protein HPB52_021425 [Rhipicephalus sanguineus]|uniref:BEN domain-containing protein n=1 Tax=Rhipicephalus sanguineus TaxID=34632 RepID=A0A9D4PDT0_RHISA|nr:hypothetical protein HPB52_021425 [Rhipicephalus sanguineus]